MATSGIGNITTSAAPGASGTAGTSTSGTIVLVNHTVVDENG
jgi:hypothetical protein